MLSFAILTATVFTGFGVGLFLGKRGHEVPQFTILGVSFLVAVVLIIITI